MKVALVHDSFTQLGGAERVMDSLHKIFPDAPVFTLVLDKKMKPVYKTWDIRVSNLQKFYNFFPKFKYWLALIPWAVSTLNFEGFDLVISSSSSFVKNIHVPKNATHICFCHTPTRFLWSEPNYVNEEVPFILRFFAKKFLEYMRSWDLSGAGRVTFFLANSNEVKKRIQKFYSRESVVIYPCINVNFWKKTKEKENFFLLAGRLQAHKNNEILVKVINELNLPLKVAGTGRQLEYLKSIAKPNIEFLGRVSDSELRDLYGSALGYIYPQIEDFGLMPIEASACGTATLAFGKGGSLETILEGITGEFFYSYDKEEIKQKILNWKSEKYLEENLRKQAEKFSEENFEKEFLEIIEKLKINAQ
jgi:glycosyltransferase involved in cell wall biosynthesis